MNLVTLGEGGAKMGEKLFGSGSKVHLESLPKE